MMNGMLPDLKLLIRLKDALGSNETTFGFYSFMDAPAGIQMLWRAWWGGCHHLILKHKFELSYKV